MDIKFDVEMIKTLTSRQSEVQPNLVLMCKLLLLLLVTHGFWYSLNDPFIPFIKSMDIFNLYPNIFKIALRTIFLISGMMLLFNFYIKQNCIILGLLIITALIASKPVFRNHLFIIGCIYLLTGLSSNQNIPKLIIYQIAIVYLSAFLSKITDIDWLSGQFMHNWLHNAIKNPYYLSIYNLAPKLYFAKFLSWTSIFTELLIGILLLRQKHLSKIVWMIILFHACLYTFSATRFGFFMDDIFIILIAFLTWPKSKVKVEFTTKIASFIKFFIGRFDWAKNFETKEIKNKQSYWLKIQYDQVEEENMTAMRSIILYSPIFYILIFIFITLITFIEMNEYLRYFLTLLILWGGIFFFLPIEKLKSSHIKIS